MKIYQPGYAYFATGTLAFFLIFYAILWIIARRIVRNRPAGEQQAANVYTEYAKVNNYTGLYASCEIVAFMYSKAFDMPHETSVRSWIVLASSFIGPLYGSWRVRVLQRREAQHDLGK